MCAPLDNGGFPLVNADAIRCSDRVLYCPPLFNVSTHPRHKYRGGCACDDRSTHHDPIRRVGLPGPHGCSGWDRHRFARLMAGNTTRSTPLNGASRASTFAAGRRSADARDDGRGAGRRIAVAVMAVAYDYATWQSRASVDAGVVRGRSARAVEQHSVAPMAVS
jgi:hypothetical protein